MKHNRLRATIILSILFTIVAPLSAQEVNLTGKVIDPFGAPVINARLRLKNRNYSTLTKADGQFIMDGRSHGAAIKTAPRQTRKTLGFTHDYLQLGNYFNTTISVFSVRGVLLNRLPITNQNKVALNTLIPSHIRSQALIISIITTNGTFSLRAIRCGSRWLINNRALIKASLNAIAHSASSKASPADMIIVEHDAMQTIMVPVQTLVAVLPDIVLDYIVEPVTPASDNPIMGDVAIAPPSSTFLTTLAVTLSTAVPGAEIRYTTDGTLPTVRSTLYGGDGITLSQTTQLRAAAFSDGVQKGKPSTAIFIARTFEYTSDIPIIVLDGYGGGAPKDKYNFIDVGFMTFEPINGVASFANGPTVATRAGYHLRGQSSMLLFAQAPYRLELWDNYDEDADYPVAGMPADADWTLISPCRDNSLIRNAFVYDMGKAIGLATIQSRFVELFINQDGGPLEAADYQGVYAITQPIKNRKHILDLKKLRPEDTEPDKLSGGYIFRFDQGVYDKDMIKLECVGAKKMGTSLNRNNATCFADLELVAPSAPNQQQLDWITSYIQEFHDALHAKPIGDWKKYIDFNSFVNIHIINEVSRDFDAWIRSHFMYKDRGKPITAGPLWDYNFAFGNLVPDTEGWHSAESRMGSNDWYLLMWEQPEFKTAFKNRYLELRKSVLSDNGIDQLIDNIHNSLRNVGQRNYTAYPMGHCKKTIGELGGNIDLGELGGRQNDTENDEYEGLAKAAFFNTTTKITDSTWTGNVDSLRTWTKRRLINLDALVAALP